MRAVGMRPVVVHGGGPQIGELMARLGKEPEFRDGLRVTDAETLDIARMVLVGQVNRDDRRRPSTCHGPIGGRAVGRGRRAASRRPQRDPELGFVGDVVHVEPGRSSTRLLDEDLIPVISTIGADADGQAYNINADTAAGAIAEALGAEKLIYLTDVAGPAGRRRRPDCLISRLSADAARLLIADGTHHRRHDPQDRGLPRTPSRRRRLGPHPRRPRPPRASCSSCSPTPASAP